MARETDELLGHSEGFEHHGHHGHHGYHGHHGHDEHHEERESEKGEKSSEAHESSGKEESSKGYKVRTNPSRPSGVALASRVPRVRR